MGGWSWEREGRVVRWSEGIDGMVGIVMYFRSEPSINAVDSSSCSSFNTPLSASNQQYQSTPSQTQSHSI